MLETGNRVVCVSISTFFKEILILTRSLNHRTLNAVTIKINDLGVIV